MGRRAARATHLALFGLGIVLYLVFVLPRWWVLVGDIPDTLATVGRIAAGIPIALAAFPVLTILRQALGRKAKTPEFALRLRAWSAVLHVVAGALILLAAIAEIWLGLGAAGPYLFAVYGAAAAIAILAALAFYLSFVAEKPPAEPKPAKPAKVKKAKPAKKPRGKKGAAAAPEATEDETADADTTDTEMTDAAPVGTEIAETEAAEAESETAVVPDVEDTDQSADVSTTADQPAALRNKRPRRLRR